MDLLAHFKAHVLDPHGLSIQGYLKLPHPRRIELSGTLAAFRANARFRPLVEALANPAITPDNLLYGGDAQVSSIRHGLNHAILMPLKYQLSKGRIFEIRNSLFERLALTDIDDDLPCRTLRLPFPVCYFQLEKPRTDFVVPNEQTGEHPWEGVYLFEFPDTTYVGYDAEGNAIPRQGRVIELLFIGSTKDQDPDNDATWAIPLFMAEDASLNEELERLVASRAGRAPALDEAPFIPNEVEHLQRLVFQTARILLYLNCAQARTQAVSEHSELMAKVERAGPAKRPKLLRQFARTYDFIRVGPEQFPELKQNAAGGRSVSAHLRRGHFRNQRYGEGRELVRVVWIDATMVNAEKVPAAPEPKQYRVS